jgi:hypothetical protein
LRSPQKAQLCNPCLRNELSPLSQEGHASPQQTFILNVSERYLW